MTLVRGFDEARGRFDQAVATAGFDPDAAFIPLLEVVAWAGAIGDYLLKRSKAKTKVVPPTIQGLYYVRNRALHYGADALSRSTVWIEGYGRGGYGKGPYGKSHTISRWVWKRPGSLPKGRSDAGKGEFNSLLANNPVDERLATAAGELARWRRL